jgi:hypothetical protein
MGYLPQLQTDSYGLNVADAMLVQSPVFNASGIAVQCRNVHGCRTQFARPLVASAASGTA